MSVITTKSSLAVGDRIIVDGTNQYIVAIVHEPEGGLMYGIADSPADCPQRWGRLSRKELKGVA